MNPSENKDSLDELLAKTVGRGPLKFDFDTWKKQHSQEIAEYRSQHSDTALPTQKGTIKMKSLMIKIAVAAGILIAIPAGIGIFGTHGANVVFADVLNNIQNRNYAFELVLNIPEENSSYVSSTNRVLIQEPGKMRFDSDTMSSVTDLNSGKTLILFHRNKTAVIMDNLEMDTNSGDTGIAAFLTKPVSALWNLKDGLETSLGTKEIDGRKTTGFAVSQEDSSLRYHMSIWANVDDSTPCLVEVTATPKDKKELPFQWTLRKFEMDIQCTDSQFRLETPVGYTLAYQKKLEEMPGKGIASSSAKQVEESLKLWTDGKKDQAVELLLNIDWTLPVEFGKQPYIFSMTEKEAIALKSEDQNKVVEESLASAAVIKQIAKYLVAQGQAAAASKDYDKAERYYAAGNQLGYLLDKEPDGMILARMVGVAVQKMALNESIKLYTQTNNPQKLEEVQKELETVTAWGDEIKRKAAGK